MRKMILVLIVIVGLFIMPAAMADGQPEIKDFTIVQFGDKAKISFNFANVAGGIEKAKFTVGFILNGGVVYGARKDLQLDIKHVTIKYDGNNENGEVEALAPLFSEGLNPGDVIQFFVSVTDAKGRSSKPVIYEFRLERQLEI